MPSRFTHLAFLLFIITALSGLWMRLFPFLTNSGLPYDHLLHGHSHIAVLGWAFFGLYIIFIKLLWPRLKERKHATILGTSIFVVSLIMFFAFLYEGYATYSIIMSTIHIFVEYWAIVFIFRRLREDEKIPKLSSLFMKGALISLFLSSIGPFALGYLGATGLKESALFEMSIYFFLHFQYNGFLSLFLLGLLFMMLYGAGVNFSKSRARTGFWIYFLSLFPWYLSSILWADLGSLAEVVARLGSTAQFIGIVTIILSLRPAIPALREKFHPLISTGLAISFLFFLIKGLMEFGLVLPGLAELVFDTRSVIVGYLHLTLLGFISFFLIVQFQMAQLIEVEHRASLSASLIFLIGFTLNELILFFQGLASWTGSFVLPRAAELLVLSSLLLSLGIVLYWLTIRKKSSP